MYVSLRSVHQFFAQLIRLSNPKILCFSMLLSPLDIPKSAVFRGCIYTPCNTCSVDPPYSAFQTASGSVRPFLHSSRQRVHTRYTTTTTTVLQPFFRDHPGEPAPEENFWTLWCKGRLTEADTLTIRLGTTPSGLTSAHLHHSLFFTGRMPFLPPNQQCQSTEGKNL